jgi:hypothetical protein
MTLRCKQPECVFSAETLTEMRAHYIQDHPDAKGASESAARQRRVRAEARGTAPTAGDVKPDTRPATAPPSTSATPRAGTLERRLLEFFGLAALLPSMLGDQFCTAQLLNNAPALAQVWANAANEHKWLKDALEKMLSASTLTAALGTTAMTVYPMLVHHKLAPALRIPHEGAAPEPVAAPTTNGQGATRGSGLVG